MILQATLLIVVMQSLSQTGESYPFKLSARAEVWQPHHGALPQRSAHRSGACSLLTVHAWPGQRCAA